METADVEVVAEVQVGKWCRKLTSLVWNNFEILPLGDDKKQRAKCMKCGTIYLADSSYGIGNLKCHIISCSKTTHHDLGQFLVSQVEGSIITRSSKFDLDEFGARFKVPFSVSVSVFWKFWNFGSVPIISEIPFKLRYANSGTSFKMYFKIHWLMLKKLT